MNLNSYNDYLVIPVNLCQYAFEHKKIRELQIYVALKCLSSGILTLDSNIKKKLSKELKVNVRTIDNAIKSLLQLKWIGKKGDVVYVRSFYTTNPQYEYYQRLGVIFYKGYLTTFRVFVVCCLITLVIKSTLKRQRKTLGVGRFPKRGNKSSSTPFVPVASIGLSTLLNCSKTTAFNYKELGAKHGYLDIQKRITEIPIQQINGKVANEFHSGIFMMKGKFYIRETDLVKSNITLRRRKKMNYIKRGYWGGI